MVVFVFSLFIPLSFSDQTTFDQLWNIPFEEVISKLVKSYNIDTVHVEELYYESRDFKGQPSKIFAYYCSPRYFIKKLPGVLVVHGGGGGAKLKTTLDWARHGYAVLSIDLPGKGFQRLSSRSSGPDMDVPILLRTKPDLTYNYLVHAVAAARNGITYLSKRNEVDPDRLGMVGLSWGGVITLLTNGQDKRLKAAVNVFGSGFIPEGCTWQDRFNNMDKEELAQWNTYIDPKNFLKTQTAPILFMTGTNDHCYYLPPFQKSYEEVTAYKKLLLIPNLKHQFFPYMQSIAWNWLDAYLKNNGKDDFPQISFLPMQNKGEDKIVIPVVADPFNKIKSVTLYYANGGPNSWTLKEWKSMEAFEEDGIYYFGIPTTMITPELLFFVNAKDFRGATSSTPIKSLFRIVMPENKNTFALTSPIQNINVHQQPIQFFGTNPTPDYKHIFFSERDKTYQMVRYN